MSGKGLLAATQIAVVRNMLRYVVYQDGDLGASIAGLNTVLAGHHLLNGFVTLFVAIHDRGSSSLTYVSCGHEPAILRRAAGNVEMLTPTGMALGVLPGTDYEHASVPLLAGDTLLIYSDGASEAGPNRRTQLGVEGLRRVLEGGAPYESARDCVMTVSDGVREAANGDFHDDVCILVAAARADITHVPGSLPQ